LTLADYATMVGVMDKYCYEIRLYSSLFSEICSDYISQTNLKNEIQNVLGPELK